MYNDEKKIKVKALLEEGNSLRQISDLNGVPKSTVADWIQEGIELSRAIQSNTVPGKNPPDRVFKGITDETDNVSGGNRPIPEQIKTKNEISMNEHDENKTNRTEMGYYQMSPEMVEVEKLKIQLQHEREMRKLDIEKDSIELQKQEILQTQRSLEIERQMINQIGEEFSEAITEIAQFINDKGQNSDWEYDEIQELFDKLDHISENLLPVVKKNDLYDKNSIYFKFLRWIFPNCNNWIEEVEEIDVLEIEFMDEQMELVSEIIPSDDTDSPDQDSSEFAEIRALIRRRIRKRRRDAENNL